MLSMRKNPFISDVWLLSLNRCVVELLVNATIERKMCVCVFVLQERPPPEKWQKLERSRDYRNGNQLREYQLEGMNWLLFNWYNR